MSYKPRPEQAAILDRGFELVQSVPYKVTARWLFYGLLQESFFRDKKAYKKKFVPLLSKARKKFYKGWTPDTLEDDTRRSVIRGEGWQSEGHFLGDVGRMQCRLDKWERQENYVEIWFEAKAMRGQFEHYTRHITLRPFGGDPSLPFKSQIARELSEASQRYDGKPIIILYFGDMDPKGFQIPISAAEDIRRWSGVDFEFIRCGLNPGDEVTFHIPENPDKPGTYQWEAVSDLAARELITGWTDQFVSQGLFSEDEEREREITRRFQARYAEHMMPMEAR